MRLREQPQLRALAIRAVLLKERLTTGVSFNPMDPGVFDDPHGAVGRLREKDPVHWSPLLHAWVLTRQDDIAAVLRDPRFAADRGSWSGPGVATGGFSEFFHSTLLSLDAPAHTRVRACLAAAFTPASVDARRPRIEALTRELLDGIEGRDEVDIVQDFGVPLPIIIIAEMLGIPGDERSQFRAWSVALARGLDPMQTSAERRRADDAVEGLNAYFDEVISMRRAQPGSDLVSTLLAESDAAGAAGLGRRELLSALTLLLLAGNETTANLLSASLRSLLVDREAWRRLGTDPRLVDGAVEELLRFHSPVQATSRVAKEEVVVGGRIIRRRQMVYLLLGGANIDPEHYEHPRELDIERKDVRHLAFGTGPHVCLGAALGRAEAQVALRQLAERFPKMTLAGESTFRNTFMLRGLDSLLVRPGQAMPASRPTSELAPSAGPR